jgi:hypothetical protein
MLPEKLFADPNFSMLYGILAKGCILGKFHPQPSSLGRHSFIRLMRMPRTFKDPLTCDLGCGFQAIFEFFKEIFLSFISFHINFCPE